MDLNLSKAMSDRFSIKTLQSTAKGSNVINGWILAASPRRSRDGKLAAGPILTDTSISLFHLIPIRVGDCWFVACGYRLLTGVSRVRAATGNLIATRTPLTPKVDIRTSISIARKPWLIVPPNIALSSV